MNIAVTYSPHLAAWFADIAVAVTKGFNEIGHTADLIPSHSLTAFDATHHELIFIIAPHGYEEQRQVFTKNPTKKYACWDLEQTPFLTEQNSTTLFRFARTLKYYGKYDYFFTEADSKTDYFIQRGYKAHTLNFGYHSHYTKEVDADKSYDIFFVGSMFPRRSAIIQSLKQKGLMVHPSPNFDPILKAKAVKSSKICLNIHFNEQKYFEKPRIIQDIMSNGGFCLTETIAYPETFENNKHFVMTDYSNLVSTIEEWICKPQERATISANALNHLEHEYQLTAFLRKAMAIMC